MKYLTSIAFITLLASLLSFSLFADKLGEAELALTGETDQRQRNSGVVELR